MSIDDGPLSRAFTGRVDINQSRPYKLHLRENMDLIINPIYNFFRIVVLLLYPNLSTYLIIQLNDWYIHRPLVQSSSLYDDDVDDDDDVTIQ